MVIGIDLLFSVTLTYNQSVIVKAMYSIENKQDQLLDHCVLTALDQKITL